jgi:hypothetical protein
MRVARLDDMPRGSTHVAWGSGGIFDRSRAGFHHKTYLMTFRCYMTSNRIAKANGSVNAAFGPESVAPHRHQCFFEVRAHRFPFPGELPNTPSIRVAGTETCRCRAISQKNSDVRRNGDAQVGFISRSTARVKGSDLRVSLLKA